MTRAKKLKRAIRNRALKTRESYAAARRNVVKPVAVPPRASAGGIADERFRAKTGHGLDHWFAVLDAFDAPRKGHGPAARHLSDEHGVPSWYCQMITVAYERVRGLRALNQRCDGEFSVSISRIVPASLRDVRDAFEKENRRGRWIGTAPQSVRDALQEGLKSEKPIRLMADGLRARMRFKPAGIVVEIQINEEKDGRSRVVAVLNKLQNAQAVETHRGLWSQALDGLRDHFAGRPSARPARLRSRNVSR